DVIAIGGLTIAWPWLRGGHEQNSLEISVVAHEHSPRGAESARGKTAAFALGIFCWAECTCLARTAWRQTLLCASVRTCRLKRNKKTAAGSGHHEIADLPDAGHRVSAVCLQPLPRRGGCRQPGRRLRRFWRDRAFP